MRFADNSENIFCPVARANDNRPTALMALCAKQRGSGGRLSQFIQEARHTAF